MALVLTGTDIPRAHPACSHELCIDCC